MSITDELREYVGNFYLFRYKDVREKLNEIADHIDIAHKHAIGYVDDRDPETMAENGWVRLPKDADGVPIHVGDVMENIVCPSVHREVTGVGVECFYGWDEGNGRYSQFDVACYRHHHAPTVEDVLREFTDEVWNRCCEGATASDSGIDELVAEYAAKLRLAGDGE